MQHEPLSGANRQPQVALPSQQPTVSNKVYEPGVINIDGKIYRIRQVKIGENVINFDDLKFKDQLKDEKFRAHIESLVKDVITKSRSEANLPTHRITLTSTGVAHFDNKKIEGDYTETLKKVQATGTKILERQEKRKITDKHTITSHVPGLGGTIFIRILTAVAAVLTAPVTIPLGLAINAGTYLGKSLHRAIHKTDDLRDASHKMKADEEKSKFKGLRKAYADFKDLKTGLISTEPLAKELNVFQLSKEKQKEILANKAERHIDRALKRENISPDNLRQEISKLKAALEASDFENFDRLKTKFSEVYPLNELVTNDDIQRMVDESEAVFKDTSVEDKRALKALVKALKVEKPRDLAIANQQITAAYRAVIELPSYQVIEQDPNSTVVQLISHLVSANWNGVEALPAYNDFGKTVLNKIGDEKLAEINGQRGKTSGEIRREILEEGHKRTVQDNYTDHGLPAKLLYAFTHPRQALGSLASEGTWKREIAGAFGYDRYDSHGELSNNPSIQGVTECKMVGGINAKINNCYGGSPTIGDRDETRLAPEFRAICQAAENKRYANLQDEQTRKIYESIPDVVYYTNFQDLNSKGGEGERSGVINKANTIYPLSFYGMTLSKDSDFYFSEGKYKDIPWESAEDFGKLMLEIFNDKKCYQYGGRTTEGNGNGIYLPGGKKAWMAGTEHHPAVIPGIIGRANKRFEAIADKMLNPSSPENTAKLKGAYQEYVYSMIQAHTEMKLAKNVAEVTGNKNPVVMAIRACKENIDRGGAENAKYMHTRLGATDDTAVKKAQDALVVGCLESRALSARDRTILDKRLPQVFSFIELVDPKEFEEDMMTLYAFDQSNIVFVDGGKPKFTPVLPKAPPDKKTVSFDFDENSLAEDHDLNLKESRREGIGVGVDSDDDVFSDEDYGISIEPKTAEKIEDEELTRAMEESLLDEARRKALENPNESEEI